MSKMLGARIVANHRVYDILQDDGTTSSYPTTNTCTTCGEKIVLGINWYKSRYDKKNRMCNLCSNACRTRSRRKQGTKPMDSYKEYSAYLGVHIAEQALSKVFKDVKTMPYGNSGYDFICNKGKKIDVKAACLQISNGRHGDKWSFAIRHNTTADHFLLLAFDNRVDLTPLHIWLIPGHMFNKFYGVSICASTMSQYGEYVIDIAKVVRCCDSMKGV